MVKNPCSVRRGLGLHKGLNDYGSEAPHPARLCWARTIVRTTNTQVHGTKLWKS
jgi:hypothetical protein